MRKPTRKSLTRKLDKICSDIVRKNPCARCKESQYDKIQCAHIFSRTYKSVRWYLANMIPLCASCHFWGHKNPILFTEFVKSYLGDLKYQELKSIAQPISKWTIPQMEVIYVELEKIKEGGLHG